MTTWIAEISNDQDLDNSNILEIELDADSEALALEQIGNREDWTRNHYIVTLRRKRGGRRAGAGRPKGIGRAGTYGQGVKTKAVRVPEAIAPRLPDLINNLEQLGELLEDWEAMANESTSPRYDRAKKLLREVRELGF